MYWGNGIRIGPALIFEYRNRVKPRLWASAYSMPHLTRTGTRLRAAVMQMFTPEALKRVEAAPQNFVRVFSEDLVELEAWIKSIRDSEQQLVYKMYALGFKGRQVVMTLKLLQATDKVGHRKSTKDSFWGTKFAQRMLTWLEYNGHIFEDLNTADFYHDQIKTLVV